MGPGRRAWRVLGPLLWGLGLVAASRWPGLPAHVPALGVLRGPLGACLLVLAAAVALCGLRRRPSPLPQVRPFVLFAFSAGLFLALGIHYTSRLRASGDEPHYLLMAQSLWREGDLDLRDNYEREDYRDYTPGPLAPHYGAPRRDGRPFPLHSPGLPALLAPVYALGGRRACAIALALAAAALVVQVRALAFRLTGDAGAALLSWAAALGPPVAFYAFHVYTEVPSALALSLALGLLLGSPGAAASALAALLTSALPWLHVKMVPAAVALGVVAFMRLRGPVLAAFILVAGLMTACYLGFYYSVFGAASPLAIYGGVPADAGGTPAKAALGLLLDRSFGLLPHAPVFLLTLSGAPPLLRRPWREAAPHLLLAVAIFAPILPWRMWWGGQCPPGRFLVPLVPFLAGLLALRAAAGPPKGLDRWRWALLGLGMALTLFMTARPGELMLLNRGDRPTRVWAALSGETPLERYLPSLVAGDRDEVRVAALWTGAIAVLIALDRLARRREAVDRLFQGLGLPLILLLILGLLVDFWARAAPARP